MIGEQHLSRGQKVGARAAHLRSVQMGLPQRVVVYPFGTITYGLFHGLDARGWVDVVQRGVDPRKPLRADELFFVECAIGLAELSMALGGNFSEAVVVHG